MCKVSDQNPVTKPSLGNHTKSLCDSKTGNKEFETFYPVKIQERVSRNWGDREQNFAVAFNEREVLNHKFS